MKTLLLFTALLLAVTAKVVQMPTMRSGSIRAKLIAKGVYSQFLEEQYHARTQILATGSQPFMDYFDNFYLGNVTVGTPPQQVTLVLDTGSSNLWVIDAACTSEACDGASSSGYVKNKYDPSKSSTYQTESRKWRIQYESGSSSGHLAKDVLIFGGLTVQQQEFGVAEHLARVFAFQPMDGVMGLAWPGLAVDGVTPPMQNVLPQLDQPIFTVFMDRKLTPSEGGLAGLITYGAVDNQNCDPTVNYVPLSADTYWQFPMQGCSMGSYSQSHTDQVISDTGTSWIGMPNAVLVNIVQQTSAVFDKQNQLYTVDCGQMKSLPDLVLTIGGLQYSIPSVEYVLDVGLNNGQCAVTFFMQRGGGGFGPTWILGDTFIRSYCNVYDIGQQRIGFAKARHNF